MSRKASAKSHDFRPVAGLTLPPKAKPWDGGGDDWVWECLRDDDEDEWCPATAQRRRACGTLHSVAAALRAAVERKDVVPTVVKRAQRAERQQARIDEFRAEYAAYLP